MQDETLRRAVTSMEQELVDLSRKGAPEAAALVGVLGAWAGVVKALALETAPELRDCPLCRRSGMRAATLCGYCWTTLTPPPAGQA